MILLFICGSIPLQAQLVRLAIEIEETEPVDFSNATDENVVRNDDGTIFGMDMAGCIRITSKENVPVIVKTKLTELKRSYDNKNTPTIEPRYINDGGECPVTSEMVDRVSGEFVNGIARFRLQNILRQAKNLPDFDGKVMGLVTFLGNKRYENPLNENEVDKENEQEYEGVFTIDIEYL